MISNAARRSATRRAIGPMVTRSCAPIGCSAGSTLLALGIRPKVGLSVLTPQHWAGQRSEPSPSAPIPSEVIRVVKAAASPPVEAPGSGYDPRGLIVAPHTSLTQCQRTAKLARFV